MSAPQHKASMTAQILSCLRAAGFRPKTEFGLTDARITAESEAYAIGITITKKESNMDSIYCPELETSRYEYNELDNPDYDPEG